MLRRSLARRILPTDVVSCCLRRRSRFPNGHEPGHSPNIQTPRFCRTYSSTTDPSHDSLSSFLAYAQRTNLDRASTTFAGTYYEYATQSHLRRYGFDLTRVGGRGDRGVDLKGSWTIRTEKIESELSVIVQCKRLKGKVGPNLIRELEGALAGRTNTLGVLVGTKGATKGVRDAMGRSKVGICWVMLEVEEGANDPDEKEGQEERDGAEEAEAKERQQEQGFNGILQSMKDEIVSKSPKAVQDLLEPSPVGSEGVSDAPVQLGRVRQMLWNRAASNMGLEGLDVVMKYDGTRDEGGEVGKEVMLKWQGKGVQELT